MCHAEKRKRNNGIQLHSITEQPKQRNGLSKFLGFITCWFHLCNNLFIRHICRNGQHLIGRREINAPLFTRNNLVEFVSNTSYTSVTLRIGSELACFHLLYIKIVITTDNTTYRGWSSTTVSSHSRGQLSAPISYTRYEISLQQLPWTGTIHQAASKNKIYFQRSRRLFITTETELKAMAALANIGLSNSPHTG